MTDKTEADANKRLRRARKNAGLDPDTGADPGRGVPKIDDTLEALLAKGAAHAVPPDKYPAPPPPRAEVPEKFKGITLDALATLEGPNGPALGGVETTGGILFGAEAVEEIRRVAIRAPRVVLLGATHTGKTITACALLQDAAARGAKRPRFVRESDLREPDAIARAVSADVLVLDNLGWALDGAPGESALAAQKRGPTCDLIDRLSLRNPWSFKIITTTWLEELEMARAYSGGVVARVYEGAEVIRIVRPEVRR